MKGNQGGISIHADSRGSATSLRAFIHHSLFVDNRNRPSLYMEGRQSSPYQEVTIFKNYFSQNKAAYADVIALRQVVSNFSYNYVHSNQGEQNEIYLYYLFKNLFQFDFFFKLEFTIIIKLETKYMKKKIIFSGGRICEISGFDKVRLPIYQTTAHNGFYE